MKKLTVIALFSLLSTGAALADGLSREQVVTELQRARAAGELLALHGENPDAIGRTVIAAGSTTSRAAVLAELQRARNAGELQGRDAESYSLPTIAGSSKSRAEVIAELQQARARGQLQSQQISYGG
ncbi:hypothetical protein OOZ63_11980 [Paucibacter sp. PLA-PC-4]|uniref:hypothetical protein n=1 Tax=Paucibacter sp. PLA-PC-4 TaxID=2993655 RepID=UPI002249065D|nr:hypothetical protein [Paucibacter sp. PLA-PC-4]MCX2862560.1 hypothetical protein [Paucibacter sp. PLA-PC-4]